MFLLYVCMCAPSSVCAWPCGVCVSDCVITDEKKQQRACERCVALCDKGWSADAAGLGLTGGPPSLCVCCKRRSLHVLLSCGLGGGRGMQTTATEAKRTTVEEGVEESLQLKRKTNSQCPKVETHRREAAKLRTATNPSSRGGGGQRRKGRRLRRAQGRSVLV